MCQVNKGIIYSEFGVAAQLRYLHFTLKSITFLLCLCFCLYEYEVVNVACYSELRQKKITAKIMFCLVSLFYHSQISETQDQVCCSGSIQLRNLLKYVKLLTTFQFNVIVYCINSLQFYRDLTINSQPQNKNLCLTLYIKV